MGSAQPNGGIPSAVGCFIVARSLLAEQLSTQRVSSWHCPHGNANLCPLIPSGVVLLCVVVKKKKKQLDVLNDEERLIAVSFHPKAFVTFLSK